MKFIIEVELSDEYARDKTEDTRRGIQDTLGDAFVPWYFKTLKITEVKDVQ